MTTALLPSTHPRKKQHDSLLSLSAAENNPRSPSSPDKSSPNQLYWDALREHTAPYRDVVPSSCYMRGKGLTRQATVGRLGARRASHQPDSGVPFRNEQLLRLLRKGRANGVRFSQAVLAYVHLETK